MWPRPPTRSLLPPLPHTSRLNQVHQVHVHHADGVSPRSGRGRDLRTVLGVDVPERRLRQPRPVQARQQRGAADAAVRVLRRQLGPQAAATRQAAGEVGEQVAAEDHVDPGVAAAVEAGQQGGQRHDGVLRFCEGGGGKRREDQWIHRLEIQVFQGLVYTEAVGEES